MPNDICENIAERNSADHPQGEFVNLWSDCVLVNGVKQIDCPDDCCTSCFIGKP